ncbi:MAG: type II toxin-antitoxin system RelE/ParE family toxin [Ruminococcus sp.]|nr:type II toxin-antitoxin system RelE/ParE family toxin [Ruminococcus sp.]
MQQFEIVFYKKEDGREPVKEFLLSTDIKMRAKMLRTIQLLQVNGNDLREPESKHLEDGIFELRAKVGSNISRVLYFFVIGQRIILTNGFIKKKQKTPKAEIERAKRYREDYLRREEHTNDSF